MVRIVPHLWFDGHAREAAEFYARIISGSSILRTTVLEGTPSPENVTIVEFELAGQPFVALDGGPAFAPNPSISFFLNFDPKYDEHAKKTLDTTWSELADGGTILMPLQEYPFSKRYGWVEDRYGISWQLILTDPSGDDRPRIIPSFLFTGANAGKAEEASERYMNVFDNSKRGALVHHPHTSSEKGVMFTEFMLENQWFAAMDSSLDHAFAFNEAISLLVSCDSQDEIDRYSDALSADPDSEVCGWCKDRYGVSWQVSPRILDEMLATSEGERKARVTDALLSMRRIDIEALQRAYDGERTNETFRG